jgi:hypothetical protein
MANIYTPNTLNIKPELYEAFLNNQKIRKEEEDKRKIDRRADEAKKFNPVNAIIDAGIAYVMSGGNPVAVVGAAATSPRGETDIVKSGIQGAGQGGILKSIYDPSAALGPATTGMMEQAGATVNAMGNVDNLQATAAYLNSANPDKSVESLAAAGQLNQQQKALKLEKLQKTFDNTMKAGKQVYDKLTPAGQAQWLQKTYQAHPEFNEIAPMEFLDVGDGTWKDYISTDKSITDDTYVVGNGSPFTGKATDKGIVNLDTGMVVPGAIKYLKDTGRDWVTTVDPTTKKKYLLNKTTGEKKELFEPSENKLNPQQQQVLNEVTNKYATVSADYRKRSMSAQNVINMLDSATPVADNVLKTQFARLAGEVGNLSEYDQKAYQGSSALVDRLKQTFSTSYKGTYTDDNRKQLKDLANLLLTETIKANNDYLDGQVGAKAKIYDLNIDTARNVLSDLYMGNKQGNDNDPLGLGI